MTTKASTTIPRVVPAHARAKQKKYESRKSQGMSGTGCWEK
jgi:hypothetical protein